MMLPQKRWIPCILLVLTIAHGAARRADADLDVIVAGVAVYQDVENGTEIRAAGKDLFLVKGPFEGQRKEKPATQLDYDKTASAENSYPPAVEGMFHFYYKNAFHRDEEERPAVSVVYCMKDVDPSVDPATSYRFFSRAFYPQLIPGNNDRLSAKVWLNLWPTNRSITTSKELGAILTGIIRVRTSIRLYEDQKPQRNLLLDEMKIVAALLPADTNSRKTILEDAMKQIPTALLQQLEEMHVVLESALEINMEERLRLREQEAMHWKNVLKQMEHRELRQ